MQSLSRLLVYMSWANRTWIDFAYDTAGGDPYLTRFASHIVLAEQAWCQRIYGEPVTRDVFETKAKGDLLALFEKNQRRFAELRAGDVTRTIAYRRFSGEAHESAVLDILLHLITHASHHRGQMAAYASQHDLDPPNTDYITCCRSGALPEVVSPPEAARSDRGR